MCPRGFWVIRHSELFSMVHGRWGKSVFRVQPQLLLECSILDYVISLNVELMLGHGDSGQQLQDIVACHTRGCDER
jgi:hypothetical protein